MKTFLTALFMVALLMAAGAADAGPLAPQPRVVGKYDRNFIERSGAQTLQELLDTGIIRYFLTGGQNLLVLVDGRPYSSTGGNLESVPLSAVERIEVLGGDSLGSIAGTVRGALNIVLRKSLDGFETRTVTRAPSRKGGDAWQGSVFWGGTVGAGGRMTLGVDVFDRQEIPGSKRIHSRSEWIEGRNLQPGEEYQHLRQYGPGRPGVGERRGQIRAGHGFGRRPRAAKGGAARGLRPGARLRAGAQQPGRHHHGRRGLRLRLSATSGGIPPATSNRVPSWTWTIPSVTRANCHLGREHQAGRFGISLRAIGRCVFLRSAQ